MTRPDPHLDSPSVVLSCPACGKRFSVQDELVPRAGRRAHCASCGEDFWASQSSEGGLVEPIHYERLLMPGDGLASGSTFAAPAAPLEIVAGSNRAGDAKSGESLWSPPIASAGPAETGSGASPSSTVGEEGEPAGGEHEERREQIQPDATVVLSPEQIAASNESTSSTPEGSRHWRTREAEGRETLCDKRELIQRIRQGLLSPEDAVTAEGASEWARAGDIPDLGFYFRLKEEAQARAAAAAAPSPVAESEPLRRRLACVLQYPLQGWGLVMILFTASIGFIATMTPILGLLLSFFVLTYDMLIVRESARGRAHLPDWPDLSNWTELADRGIKGMLVTLVSILPLLAFNVMMIGVAAPTTASGWVSVTMSVELIGGNLILLALLAAYYPMAFGITSIFNTTAPVLDPAIIVRSIARIPREYGFVVTFFVSTTAVAAGCGLLMHRSFSPFGGFLGACGCAYVNFAQMHLLGRTLHRNEHRLDWKIESGRATPSA